MDRISIILLATAGIHLLANGWVTYVILKSDQYEPQQKAFQALLIWVIPLVGVAFVYGFFRYSGAIGAGKYPTEAKLTIDLDSGLGLGNGDYFGGDYH